MVTRKQARAGVKSKVTWARVSKNPKSWRSPYSLLIVGKGSTLIFSQHHSKPLAEKARTRVVNKHKTLDGARRALGWH